MVNGSSLYAAPPHSNPRNSTAIINPESVSGVPLVMLQSNGSGWFAPGALSALQKYKVKRLDLFFVMLANSFLRERVGNKNFNSNFS
jgi:hypothetical protein